jgi:Got1/Sft2-like family
VLRLPIHIAGYVGSLLATLYASLFMHSYVLSLLCCVAQVGTLVYYVASFFPGGASGAQYVIGSMGRGGLSVAGAVARGIFSK